MFSSTVKHLLKQVRKPKPQHEVKRYQRGQLRSLINSLKRK